MATDKPTPTTATRRPLVRKIAAHWRTSCPCGFTWQTRHHRLALMFALEHQHREFVSNGITCLNHCIDFDGECVKCEACSCNVIDGRCRNCGWWA